MKPFVYGLIAAALAAGIAYIYQSIVTAVEGRHLAEVSAGSENLKPQKWLYWFARGTAIPMVLLVFFSYGTFAWGALEIAAVIGR